ncbi:uncharacterized protein tmem70 isoform X2 [Hypanus sabinus]|uniref:uncharacterized protein tmem70 isoform X2 n=1 Tax=Hypanus sabinus TaxID=79690 RepID=UPI0028C4D8C6|nr:uncharacterized protein tmem70 isoform X2 [Hypanus sabinus]
MSMAALALVLRSGAGFTGRAAKAGYAYAAARSFCIISGNKSGSIHQDLDRGRSEVLGRPQVAASCIGAQVNLTCSQHFRYFCSDENTGEGRLIYTGNLAKAVFGVKFFSYSTSIFSCCMMPYVILHSGLGIQSPALQAAFCGIIGLFTFLNPVVLHLLTKGYVIRLYHNAETDNYTAVTYNALLQQKKTIFHQKDVEVPGVNKMFTTFYANKKSMDPLCLFCFSTRDLTNTESARNSACLDNDSTSELGKCENEYKLERESGKRKTTDLYTFPLIFCISNGGFIVKQMLVSVKQTFQYKC